ncbi:MAG: peroxidase-related enzyme [Betaproteobacteria bacterium]
MSQAQPTVNHTPGADARPISRWPVPAVADLPEDLKARILEVQDKAGFVPNVFLALAHRPAELRAFLAYHDALLLKPEEPTAPDGTPRGLSKGEREMIIVATSGANHCLYCVVAHGAILRVYEKKPLLADQLAVNHRKADVTPRQRAMLDFAMKVCLDSAAVDEADCAALRAHGFSDEDIWDIGAITAFFGLSNRMANLTAMRPNDEFYLMGRVPRSKG